ncbi:hypothetical protein [Streptomyces huiliensis]|uniref:hypothetical protein n=1 Tax=Streptomyces huiliensis TaxID=2876027 RepID=UPI001CBE409B|nr:hypothetical protein [Streptomyces huiliensis]MBZ4319928.1 hypothetical protein [Streptomyces huiliensis]
MNTTVIVPPGGDPSLRPVWPGAHRLLEPGRRFVARVLRDTAATGASTAADAPERAALLRAAAAALADPDGPLERLRAAALLMRTATGPDDRSTVQVTLDDIALADGSTEDSDAVLRAVRGPVPYQPELDAAVAAVRSDDEVWIVLDRDQQLPATAALAERLPGRPRITGRYARTHGHVLGRLTPFRSATFARPPAAVHWSVAGLPDDGRPTRDGAPVHWRERAADAVPPGPWAGRIGLRDLVERTGELIDGGCVTAVLGVCAADEEVLLGRGGSRAPAAEVRAATARLRAAGVTVLAELWLGAPGVDADRAQDTAKRLTAPDSPVDRVVGLRPFDWPVHWDDPAWGGISVRLSPETGPDLARHRRFEAPGTLEPQQVTELVNTIGPGLARAGHLVPARTAAAYLATGPSDGHGVPADRSTSDDRSPSDGRSAADGPTAPADQSTSTDQNTPGIRLAPEVRLVTVDTTGGAQWYAVDLRLGRVVRLDPRMAGRLRIGRHPVPETDALPGTSDATRTRLLDALVRAGLLVRH